MRPLRPARTRHFLLFAALSAAAAPAGALSLGDGVNIQTAYYNGGRPAVNWAQMKQSDKEGRIRTIRIEIEPSKPLEGKSFIAQAHEQGYAVIATYHKVAALGSDDTRELMAAANWWRAHYADLRKAGPFTINVMNEWGSHDLAPDQYARAYNEAIGVVRGVYAGPIIVDIPGWGQETAVAACAVKGAASGCANASTLDDKNIVLSAHVYPSAWNRAKGRALRKDDLDDLASAGRPCLIGEFGSKAQGGADWSGIVDHAKRLGWPVIGWAWNGDGGDMNMVSPSWAKQPDAATFLPNDYFGVIYTKLGP